MTVRGVAVLVAAAVSIAFAAGCSDDSSDSDPIGSSTSSSGAAALASSTSAGPASSTSDSAPEQPAASGSASSAPSTSTTRAVPPPAATDDSVTLEPADIGIPEQPPLNEAGEPITLDETANLACAHAQFAWVALQTGDGDGADTEIAGAATRAEVSDVDAIAALAGELRAVIGTPGRLGPVEALLDVCLANGFET